MAKTVLLATCSVVAPLALLSCVLPEVTSATGPTGTASAPNDVPAQFGARDGVDSPQPENSEQATTVPATPTDANNGSGGSAAAGAPAAGTTSAPSHAGSMAPASVAGSPAMTDGSPNACTVQCDRACVDVQSDDAHCGRCGHSCGGDGCTDGLCTPKLLFVADGSYEVTANAHGIFYTKQSDSWDTWNASSNASLVRAGLDGSNLLSIVSASSAERPPYNFVFDEEAAYWAVGSGEIYRIPHNRSNGEVLPGLRTTHNIAVGGGNLFFYNGMFADEPLLKQSTQGGAPSELAMGSGDLQHLVGNELNVYGIDYDTSYEIKEVPVNGGNATSLSIPAMNPDGLALDEDNLYVRSWMDRVVLKLPLNGGAAVKLADAMASSIAVDETHVYLGGNDFLARVPIEGGPLEPVVNMPSTGFIGMAGDYVYLIGGATREIWRVHK